MSRVPDKKITISAQALDLNELNGMAHANRGETGAVVTFTGAVRATEEDNGLTGMTLEHYPGMTEKQLDQILDDATRRWQLNRMMVVHRIGFLQPGEPIVFVATCSLHRKEAFAAAEFIMDYLKQRATFWKKEHFGERAHWVEAKASDAEAAERW